MEMQFQFAKLKVASNVYHPIKYASHNIYLQLPITLKIEHKT